MSGPTTEAGRALLAWELAVGAEAVDAERVMDARLGPGWEMRDAILDIEAEAAKAGVAEKEAIPTYAATLRERIEGLETWYPIEDDGAERPVAIETVSRAAVLALLDEARTAE